MSLQADLIKTFCKKDSYETYAGFVHKHHFDETTDKGKDYFWQIFSVLKEFHAANDSDISADELRALHLGTMDGVSKEKRAALELVYDLILEEGRDVAEQDGPARQLLATLKRKSTCQEILSLIEKESDEHNPENWAKLKDIAENIGTEEQENVDYYTTDLMDADADYEADQRWKWFDHEFNANVKGAGPGRNALIVALTNVGKTSFTVFNCVNFMRQGAKVLHFAIAEDSKLSLMRRYYHAAFAASDRDLDKNKEVYNAKFQQEFAGRLFLYPTDSLNLAQAEQIIKDCQPDIVVFDDFKDMELGFKGDTTAPKIYGVIAKKIKGLAQKHNFFALCCAQAADTARGKQILEVQDIADSRVDIPAKFEYVIGLSRGENRAENYRWVSFLKNKKGKESIHYGYHIDEETCTWRK